MEQEPKASWLDSVYRSTLYRFATVIGLGVALVTAPLAFPPVQNALFPKQSGISVQVRRESSAIDVDRQFSGLSVVYRGQDLLASKSGLAISQIRVVNTGSVSIAETSISRSDPLGVQVIGGQVLGIIGFRASSDHLMRRARPRVVESSVILPSNIILDPNDYISFDVLILKKDVASLRYVALGKVEGVRSLSIERQIAEGEKPALVWSAFSGGPLVQAIRLLAYSIFALLTLIFLIGMLEQISYVRDRFRARRRKKLCNRIRSLNLDMEHERWVLIASLYTKHGSMGLQALRSVLSGEASRGSQRLKSAPTKDAGESSPGYIIRALNKSVRSWKLPDYVASVAEEAGIKIDNQEQLGGIRSDLVKFEKYLEEAAAEAGLSRSSLENQSNNIKSGAITELTFPEEFEDIITARRGTVNERK